MERHLNSDWWTQFPESYVAEDFVITVHAKSVADDNTVIVLPDEDAFIYWWVLTDNIEYYRLGPDALKRWHYFRALRERSKGCVATLKNMQGMVIFEEII